MTQETLLDSELAKFRPPTRRGFPTEEHPTGEVIELPYALFWRPIMDYSGGNTEGTEKMDLTMIPLSGSNGTSEGVKYYITKPRWRLVKYNVPANGDRRWVECKKMLDLALAGDVESIKATAEENTLLKQRVKDLEAKLQKGIRDGGKQ